MKDVTEKEVTALLNAIKYDSFAVQPNLNNNYYYGYGYDSPVYYDFYPNSNQYLTGDLTTAEYEELCEDKFNT
jgi:hypothetical protein